MGLCTIAALAIILSQDRRARVPGLAWQALERRQSGESNYGGGGTEWRLRTRRSCGPFRKKAQRFRLAFGNAVAETDSWRVMPRPALSRRLTWSLVGTSWFMQRRSEASMPMKATSSMGVSRAEAASEGSACASVAGWGRSRRLRICAPGPHHPRLASSGEPVAGFVSPVLHFLNRFWSRCVVVRPLRSPAPARLRMFRGLLSQ
jgi:hypothetical protein